MENARNGTIASLHQRTIVELLENAGWELRAKCNDSSSRGLQLVGELLKQ